MRKCSFFVLWAVMVAGGVFAQPWDPNFYLQRADQYKMQGEWDKALEMYNAVLNNDQGNIKALNGRGYIYQQKGDYLKAKADFQYALSINPQSGESMHNLLRVNEFMGESAVVMPSSMNSDYKDNTRFVNPSDYSEVHTGNVNSIYDRTVDVAAEDGALYNRTIAISPGATTDTLVPTNRYSQMARSPEQSMQTMQTYTPPPVAAGSGMYQQGSSGVAFPYQGMEQQYPAASSAYNSAYGMAQQQTSPSKIMTPPAIVSPQRIVAPKPVMQQTSVASLRLDALTGRSAQEVNSPAYYERIVLEYSDMIARNPNQAVAFNNRGVGYAKLGDRSKALEDFNQALRLNPFYYDAQANREQIKSSSVVTR